MEKIKTCQASFSPIPSRIVHKTLLFEIQTFDGQIFREAFKNVLAEFVR